MRTIAIIVLQFVFTSTALSLPRIVDIIESKSIPSYLVIVSEPFAYTLARLMPDGELIVLNRIPGRDPDNIDRHYLKLLESNSGDVFVIRNEVYRVLSNKGLQERKPTVTAFKFDRNGEPVLSFGKIGSLTISAESANERFVDFTLSKKSEITALIGIHAPFKLGPVMSVEIEMEVRAYSSRGKSKNNLKINPAILTRFLFPVADFASTEFRVNAKGEPIFTLNYNSFTAIGHLQRRVIHVRANEQIGHPNYDVAAFNMPTMIDFTDVHWKRENETMLAGSFVETNRGVRYQIDEIDRFGRYVQHAILPFQEELGDMMSMRYPYVHRDADGKLVAEGLIDKGPYKRLVRMKIAEDLSQSKTVEIISDVLNPGVLASAMRGDCKMIPPYTAQTH